MDSPQTKITTPIHYLFSLWITVGSHFFMAEFLLIWGVFFWTPVNASIFYDPTLARGPKKTPQILGFFFLDPWTKKLPPLKVFLMDHPAGAVRWPASVGEITAVACASVGEIIVWGLLAFMSLSTWIYRGAASAQTRQAVVKGDVYRRGGSLPGPQRRAPNLPASGSQGKTPSSPGVGLSWARGCRGGFPLGHPL